MVGAPPDPRITNPQAQRSGCNPLQPPDGQHSREPIRGTNGGRGDSISLAAHSSPFPYSAACRQPATPPRHTGPQSPAPPRHAGPEPHRQSRRQPPPPPLSPGITAGEERRSAAAPGAGRLARRAAMSTRRAFPDRPYPAPPVTFASGSTHTSRPVTPPPRGVAEPQCLPSWPASCPPKHMDTKRSSMETASSMAEAMPTKPALVPVQGRHRDERAAPHSPPPRHPDRPGPYHAPRGGGTQAALPPPRPPRTPDRPGHTGPPTRGQPTQSKAGGRRDQAPPPRKKQAEHGTGAANAEGYEPPGTALPEPCTGSVRGAHATPTWGGGGGVRRRSASAHTRNRQAARTRRATGPSPQNAKAAWNGVPPGKGRGHPDETTRNRYRKVRGRRGKHEGGPSKSQHRSQPP